MLLPFNAAIAAILGTLAVVSAAPASDSLSPRQTKVTLQRGYAWAADSRWAKNILKVKGAMPTWYWHWQDGPLTEFQGTGVKFVPNYWGPQKQVEWALREAEFLINGLPTHILAQNEIDVPSQANQNAQQAANSWIANLAKYQKRGVKVSAPQIVWDVNLLSQTVKILRSKGYEPDFIAIHSYKAFWDVQGFKDYVLSVRRAFPNKEIWITEVGVTSEGGGNMAQVKQFHVNVMNWLQTQSYVTRACIFGIFSRDNPPDAYASGQNGIFNPDGSLADLGWWFLRGLWS